MADDHNERTRADRAAVAAALAGSRSVQRHGIRRGLPDENGLAALEEGGLAAPLHPLADPTCPAVGPSVTPAIVPSVSPSIVPSVGPAVGPSVTLAVGPAIGPSTVLSVSPFLGWCECGCGERTKWNKIGRHWNRWKQGHQYRRRVVADAGRV